MRLREMGLLWMAPTCSSFVFANSSNTGRSASNYDGNIEYPPVASGNLQAKAAIFLWTLASERGVQAAMENPAGSMIFNYQPVRLGLDDRECVIQIADGCAYSRKRFGERSLKAYKFACTGTWIKKVCKRCQCPNGKHLALMITDSEGRVTGTAHLKASQAYPPGLGAAIVDAWLAHCKEVGSTDGAEALGSTLGAEALGSTDRRHEAVRAPPQAKQVPKAKRAPPQVKQVPKAKRAEWQTPVALMKKPARSSPWPSAPQFPSSLSQTPASVSLAWQMPSARPLL